MIKLLVTILLIKSNLSATTINVPDDHATIQAGIDDFDDPVFIKDGSIDHDERDKKYRKESEDKNDVKGWLPLYHSIGHQCLYKGEFEIPNSLKQAINSFLIIIAIRHITLNKEFEVSF